MRFDFHVHSRFSHDGAMDIEQIVRAAAQRGIEELCVTDHYEADELRALYQSVDIPACYKAVRAAEGMAAALGVKLRLGAEVSLYNKASHDEVLASILPYEPDFLIGSVHYCRAGDVYEQAFFSGRPRDEAYRIYIEEIALRCKSGNGYSVLGHYDYVSKQAPYADRAVRLSDAPEAFDEAFRHLAQNGIGMEINTSVFKRAEDAVWGLDVLKRYRELGGEFVTIGSDAHREERIGWRCDDALELARGAGIRYIATYERMKPIFHKI